MGIEISGIACVFFLTCCLLLLRRLIVGRGQDRGKNYQPSLKSADKTDWDWVSDESQIAFSNSSPRDCDMEQLATKTVLTQMKANQPKCIITSFIALILFTHSVQAQQEKPALQRLFKSSVLSDRKAGPFEERAEHGDARTDLMGRSQAGFVVKVSASYYVEHSE